MTEAEINALCAEIAEETISETEDDRVDQIIADAEAIELDEYMLSLGPRAYGPDEGADDVGGLFYWDLK